MMHPFIGERFGEANKNSILFIGESHYLPENSVLHTDAQKWYGSNHLALNEEEIEWISTATIYKEAMACNFSNKAHSIWGNSLWILNDAGPKHPDYRTASDHIATCNFFLRPAITSESLIVEDIDSETANLAFNYYMDNLHPTAVVFLSRKAFGCLQKLPKTPYACTPHPGCSWWNRSSPSYGGLKGREILSEFVRKLDWTH